MNKSSSRWAGAFALSISVLCSMASAAWAQGPQKVAALSVSALDTLDALGIEPAIVPAPPAADSTARWPQHLLGKYASEKYVKLAAGGRAAEGQPNPQLAQLKSFKPDLIVLDGRGRNASGELKEIAPVVELSISNASLVDSVAQNILALGAALGKEQMANRRAHELLAKMRTLCESAAAQGACLVLFNVGNRIMPQQVDARFGILYDLIGVRSILRPTDGEGGLSSGRPPASANVDDNDAAAKAAAAAAQKARQEAEAKYLDDVMAREPDWLFVVDRNAAFGEAKAAEVMATTPAIANSKAWSQKKVIFLDGDGYNWYLMAGSLGLLERSIAQIQAAFDRNGK